MIAASLSGMKAATLRLNISAERLANAAADSYKETQEPVSKKEQNKPAAISNVRNPESKIITNYPNDFAVKGKGYFQVITQGGQVAFTKDGSFKLDDQGHIVTSTGSMLIPPLTIPDNVIQAEISKKGVVTALDENQNVLKIGKITLSDFENELGLRDIGDGLKAETETSGERSVIDVDGMNSAIVPGNSEKVSNDVSISDEMAEQIVAEKSFAANAEAVNTQNEMIGTIINIQV